ncbi:MAG TPA: CinA family protein [Candidatus Limnocylindrales bacterium]|nr:CinA family protein [Candidatus Limnocylindrales bacterium]
MAASAPSYADLVERMRDLHTALRRRKATVASAESCTGGLLASVLTEHEGSSDYYRGGMSVYSNDAKTSLAGVAPQLIHSHGAVSGVVAAALARGAREHLDARIGLGITGIAGPGGATPGKPVGLVYVAVDSEALSTSRKCQWPFDRDGNRLASVGAALDLLERAVRGGDR